MNKPVCYAFIDNQNIYCAFKRKGYMIDYESFYKYLKEKYNVQKIFMFIGYIEKNEDMYSKYKEFGYEVVFRAIVETPKGIKANIDVDLTLEVMKRIDEYDTAIIVSGDGDFFSLTEYLQSQNKFRAIGIPDKNDYSSFYKKYNTTNNIFYLNRNIFYKKQKG